ncbi:MAG: hypothetical protein KDK70_11415 [Myxococcales bacterium]|nr:hypothetical protein [Myxococcales bacterium]
MRYARLNITWNGQNGDLPDPVSWHASDKEILQWATEAVRSGSVPGITKTHNVQLHRFVVDRFPANKQVREDRIYVRPPTPFGGDPRGTSPCA